MSSVQDVISKIVNFDLALVPDYVAGKALTAVMRSEAAMKIRKQIGVPLTPQDFDEAYKTALIDYGIGKPQPLLDMFKHEDIRQAFCDWFTEGGELQVVEITSAVIENDPVGQRLRKRELDSQARNEVYQLAFYLAEQIRLMKSPYDQIQDAEIRKIHAKLEFLVPINDLEDLRKQVKKRLDEQEEVIEDLHSKVGDAIGTPVDIIGSVEYKGIVFRDRRQSELAAFFDHNNVTWEYHRYSKQTEPTVVLFGPRFEIRGLPELEDQSFYVVTVPYGITEDKDAWAEQFTVIVEELSNHQPVMIVLSVTSTTLLSSSSNLHPFIADDEIADVSENEESNPVYLVTAGYWSHINWYICHFCGHLSIPDRVSPWEIIKEGAEPSPDEICPYCRDNYLELCPRCEANLYDSRDASFCDYCQWVWDKMQQE